MEDEFNHPAVPVLKQRLSAHVCKNPGCYAPTSPLDGSAGLEAGSRVVVSFVCNVLKSINSLCGREVKDGRGFSQRAAQEAAQTLELKGLTRCLKQRVF